MSNPILDPEVEAYAFRLMRSGKFRTAKPLLAAMYKEFHDKDKEYVNKCVLNLIARLKS